MKQQFSPSFASDQRSIACADFAASQGRPAAQAIQSARCSILSQNFLARTLVLGLLLISILR